MIALHVLGYEQQCEKNASFKKKSWLTKLAKFIKQHYLYSPVSSASKLNFKIITFNYDRLIEEFLFREFGQQIETFVNENIIHVYNKISFLPWQHQKLKEIADENKTRMKNGKEPKPLPFIHFGHPNYDGHRIKERKEDIFLIYDERNKINNEINEIIQHAEQIYFMGFGYHEENMKVLGFPGECQKTDCKIITNHYIKDITNDSLNKLREEMHKISEKYFLNKNINTSLSCSDFIDMFFCNGWLLSNSE
jgi:hypothetical protein